MTIAKNKWPNHPRILEINTWPWLHSLTESYGHAINLENVPIKVIDEELSRYDAIWLMGVWERSPHGRDVALKHEGLQEEYQNVLRYFSTDDVIGSPYAVHYYHVDKNLGGIEALKAFRTELSKRNILLILDFVPNHVSVDHPWILEKSDAFIIGNTNDLMTKPYDFFSIGNMVYAHGRDPNFPPWTDTVQINAFSKEARKKAFNTLIRIAESCDGVRCDMAMLMTNEIFKTTWGNRAGEMPESEYWEELITLVKEKHPEFKFIAEVYWDLEWELQQQGFDYCYDKRLYERLIQGNASSIRHHLKTDWNYNKKLLRFIENHDEERAIKIFGEQKSVAAAILILTLPGARLIFEGQTKGYLKRVPVQLGRAPSEVINQKINVFYNRFLEIFPRSYLDNGSWSLCEVKPIDISEDKLGIIAYQWWLEEDHVVIVVNYGKNTSKGHVLLNNLDFGSSTWKFKDLITEKIFGYKGDDLNTYGLYVELDAWKAHIFQVEREKS